jgi:hypothetical protein
MKHILRLVFVLIAAAVLAFSHSGIVQAKATVDTTTQTVHDEFTYLDEESGINYLVVIDTTVREMTVDATNTITTYKLTNTVSRYNLSTNTLLDQSSTTSVSNLRMVEDTITGTRYTTIINVIDIFGVSHRYQYLASYANGELKISAYWADGIKI